MGWVGLDLCDELGLVEFFLTNHGGLGQKIPLTRLIHALGPIMNVTEENIILYALKIPKNYSKK